MKTPSHQKHITTSEPKNIVAFLQHKIIATYFFIYTSHILFLDYLKIVMQLIFIF